MGYSLELGSGGEEDRVWFVLGVFVGWVREGLNSRRVGDVFYYSFRKFFFCRYGF